MKLHEVYIFKNDVKHCIIKQEIAEETLRLLEWCFPHETWNIEKIEEEGTK